MSQVVEFKYLKKEDRDKLKDSDFGYVKGSRRLFPITDAESVMSASRLLGRAKGLTETERASVKDRIIKIAKKKGFSIPKSWQTEEMSVLVTIDS